MAIDFGIIIICIFCLWGGAEWVVESASKIATRLGISELVIGLTIVSFGTSAPEFAVSIGAAIKGQADISIGNIVGSNIFNLGFILGGVALVRAISTSRSLVYRDGMVLIGCSFLLLFFLADYTLARWEGAFMLLLLLSYITYLLYLREKPDEEIPGGPFRWYEIPRLLAGLALVLAGGHFLVEAASSLARNFGVSDWVIAVTIVAAGTSAPELTTSLVAVIRGKHGISAGNLIGSDIFNLLGVLGLAGVIRPMEIEPGGYSSIVVLSGMVIAVVIMMRTGWKVSRREGALLVIVNIGRWFYDFYR